MKKPKKKAREEAKNAPVGTKEARKKYILAKFLHCGEKLAFLALWGLVRADSGSPFKGLSDSTFRRDLYALAKEGAVEIIRGKKGHIIIGFPPESTTSKPGRERKAGGKKPAGDVTGAASVGSADAALNKKAERLLDEILGEVDKPQRRLKTKEELEEDVETINMEMEKLTSFLHDLEARRKAIEGAIEIYDDLQTDRPLPEASETLIVN